MVQSLLKTPLLYANALKALTCRNCSPTHGQTLRNFVTATQKQITTVPQHKMLFRLYSNEIMSGATVKPTPFQQRILVWNKMYPSVSEVPDRVSRSQMRKAMDLFRVRSSIIMAAMVFVFAAIMAMVGRKQRNDGQSVTRNELERREKLAADRK